MNCQICCCGAEVGYTHRRNCPYPLYHATDSQYDKWVAARKKISTIEEFPGLHLRAGMSGFHFSDKGEKT
uniref:Uncharacterized protein n=1 Tax=viral metagenome TaxID=1070528 RepID=A0A6M3LSV6_9ZZZZ